MIDHGEDFDELRELLNEYTEACFYLFTFEGEEWPMESANRAPLSWINSNKALLRRAIEDIRFYISLRLNGEEK